MKTRVEGVSRKDALPRRGRGDTCGSLGVVPVSRVLDAEREALAVQGDVEAVQDIAAEEYVVAAGGDAAHSEEVNPLQPHRSIVDGAGGSTTRHSSLPRHVLSGSGLARQR